MASRVLLRTVRQGRLALRQYATQAEELHGGHAGGGKMWRNVALTVALPGVVLCYINAHLKEKELSEDFERPPFIAYEHLRIRSKNFPWGEGKKSLFHNPHVNALPDGYEDDEEE